MNWGALAPALGTLAGAGLAGAAAIPTGGLSLAALPAMAPAIAAGGMLGGAAGTVGGQFAPKDAPGMPPVPQTPQPGRPQLGTQTSLVEELNKSLNPGKGGFLKHPFV